MHSLQKSCGTYQTKELPCCPVQCDTNTSQDKNKSENFVETTHFLFDLIFIEL